MPEHRALTHGSGGVVGRIAAAFVVIMGAGAGSIAGAGPIHGGCYQDGAGQCRIRLEPFTPDVPVGQRLVEVQVTLNGLLAYDFRTDVSNPPASLTLSPPRRDLASRCGETYVIRYLARHTGIASPVVGGETAPVTCPTFLTTTTSTSITTTTVSTTTTSTSTSLSTTTSTSTTSTSTSTSTPTSTSTSTTTSTTSTTAPVVCRSPGFWATHAASGEEVPRKPNAQNITGAFLQQAIDEGTPITVCGVPLHNTLLAVPGSALEALCVAPRGSIARQLARQLTAARLNCQIETCPAGILTLLDECDQHCGGGDVDAIGRCIEDIDAFNGGISTDAPRCHDQPIPGFTPPGPAASGALCGEAVGNDCTIFDCP